MKFHLQTLYSLTQNARRAKNALAERKLVAETHVYGARGGRELKLDIYRPPGAEGPLKPLVHFHGGGWVVGSKRLIEPGFQDQVKRGYALVSVGYSLAPAETWPAQIDDTDEALTWLLENGERLSLDVSRMVLCGASAGAHLALLAGLKRDLARGILAMYPATDLRRSSEAGPIARQTLRQVFGKSVRKIPETLAKASPLLYVHDRAPPTLLIHGTGDKMVAYEQSTSMKSAMEALGIDVSLVTLPGAVHTDRRLNGPEALPQIEAFLDRVTA